jgi:hypothetical protein
MRSHAAVFFDKIIVKAFDDREECGPILDRRIARFAREEQLRINAVLVLLLQPLLRRPRADRVIKIQLHRGKSFQSFPGELIGSPECNRPSLFHDDVIAVRQLDPARRAFAVGLGNAVRPHIRRALEMAIGRKVAILLNHVMILPGFMSCQAVEKGSFASLRSIASLQRTAQVRLRSSIFRALRN